MDIYIQFTALVILVSTDNPMVSPNNCITKRALNNACDISAIMFSGHITPLDPLYTLRAAFLLPDRDNLLQTIDPIASCLENASVTVAS